MKRRTKGVLLVAGLAVATSVVSVVVLTGALAKAIDPQHSCESGFSTLIDCRYHRSSTTIGKGTPIFNAPSNATSDTASSARDTFQPIFVDVTSWAVVDCPRNYIAKRLLCAATSDATPVQAAADDPVTGL